MAVANPLGDQKDNYELELTRVKEKIKTKFVELTDCLKTRENKLLKELDYILASYLSYRNELEKVNEKIMALERTKTFHQNELQTSAMKIIHENFIAQVNTELSSIDAPIEPKMVYFECDSNRMLAEIDNLGNLMENVRNGIDYKSKKLPLVSVCEKGKEMGQLDWPLGVSVDSKTGNIYIADRSNNCVKVFDSTGKNIFKFGDKKDKGEMYYPRSVAIYQDRILITQLNHCILNYQLNGIFISRIGREGRGILEFNYIYALAISDLVGDIYICDRNNNRIQILDKNFSFKYQFGTDTLKSPRDVKLSKRYIYVLDESNPCIHLFNYRHNLHKSVICRGNGMPVNDPYFFFIDETDNVLISDGHFIHIFNTYFLLIHQIIVSGNPTGVAVDTQGRVIVVCQADRDCLQIF